MARDTIGARYPIRPELHGRLVTALASAIKQGDNPRYSYLSQHMLSKYANPDRASAEQRRKAAIDKLLRVELRNARTNIRLFLADGEETIVVGSRNMLWVIDYARRLIKRTLGGTVPAHLFAGSFSGGASTSMRRGPAMVARKFTGTTDVTPKAWDLVWPHIIASRLWPVLNPEVLNPRFVTGSIMFTVPKSDTIDRVCCKEPDLNMFLQKGVGDFIRQRLRKRCAIDLNNQTINQSLAKRAHGNGLATVDLSSASDSVTTQLVCRLLPVEWFVYLSRLRSEACEIDGSVHEFELFSSMGNGFTFELESLIFYSLCMAVMAAHRDHRGDRTISVYGDDIIIHRRLYGPLKVVLSYCGFSVNAKKSHYRGPIRESCGKHYHRGQDVTPFFIRKPIENVQDLIHVLNSIRKWSTTRHHVFGDDTLYGIWSTFAAFVPKKFWGGVDLESRETLASPVGAAMRLMKSSASLKLPQTGGYLNWQCDAHLRKTGLTESQLSVKVDLPTFVVRRPLRKWGQSCPTFMSELLDMA
ncbi:MAG: putative replicase protein [Firnpuvirus faecenecus]|uniref:RNA-directed RNA polymerase n=1 Tax=Leviviridae sp. TaxID=2027243 RepID=A0ABY3ST93_9VIRU|nr:MAG: putative replicase protein [Leviviridae sp.]